MIRFAVLCAVLAPLTFAQDFRASLTGLITDPSATTVAESHESGRCSIPLLIPGKYAVEAEARGFKKPVRENIELRISVDFTAMAGNPPNVTNANFGQIRPQQDNSPRGYLEVQPEVLT